MPPYDVVVDDAVFARSLTLGPLAGHDWEQRIAIVRLVLASNPQAGSVTQDRAVRILYFAATPEHPGMKLFYKVEGTTVTLLLARPFDGTREAEEI